MKIKTSARVLLIVAVLLSAIPAKVYADSAPPVDMFQLPWEQGKAWVSYDGLDNGFKRSSGSPHNYKNGGAIDFAPHANMVVGEDTSNAWVTAAAAGTVTQVGSCFIKIDHGNGWITEYWHLDKIQVTTGSKVSRNQKLAIIHNNKTQQVCTGNEYPGPHLHFVFRPKVVDTRFAGWTVNYNAFTNKTTYTKSGVTVPILQPLMNIPDLQTVNRGILDWNINYQGSVDPYRRERWSLMLINDSKFEVNVSPTAIGLVPVIVLLDSGGNEITRANGTLSTTQPAGFYYVEIRSDAGTGYYNMIATKLESGGATVTPSPTGTSSVPGTPTPTGTLTGSETPTPTGTPSGFETPTPTITLPASETPTPTPGDVTPGATDTFTPTPYGLTPDLTQTSIAATQTANSDFATQTSVAATLTADPYIQTAIAATGTANALTMTAIAYTPPPTGTPVASQTAVPTPTGPYVLVDVIQPMLTFDQTSLVNVSLNNVPPEGYTSTEFVCTYDPSIVEASNILAAELFGSDPASALSGPQNGQFILAIAGSNGKKATSSGTAFTFSVRGLQVGQTTVQCTARISTGQGSLQSIAYIPDLVTVTGAVMSPTPSGAAVTGQVIASKPVTIQLYDASNALVISQAANPDGTFSLLVGGGTYTIVASAPGFLNAQGFMNLVDGVTQAKPPIQLLAGDIDGNSVIDQFDALTIGMNYGASAPAAADLNNDGVINVLDLELLAANYRRSGAISWQ
jgi:murein DD-endopeptidase MepM/ murein hydrolase activator NlpD